MGHYGMRVLSFYLLDICLSEQVTRRNSITLKRTKEGYKLLLMTRLLLGKSIWKMKHCHNNSNALPVGGALGLLLNRQFHSNFGSTKEQWRSQWKKLKYLITSQKDYGALFHNFLLVATLAGRVKLAVVVVGSPQAACLLLQLTRPTSSRSYSQKIVGKALHCPSEPW